MVNLLADLDTLNVSDAVASVAVPFAEPAEPAEQQATAPAGRPKSLTVKLDTGRYWALRDFCAKSERQTGQRITHQDAMVMALDKLLEREAA